jgi:hypothetical protein
MEHDLKIIQISIVLSIFQRLLGVIPSRSKWEIALEWKIGYEGFG